MLRIFLVTIVIACTAPVCARAQSAFVVLSQFHLIGTWSPDCARLPSKDNERLIFSAKPQGGGTLRIEFANTDPPILYQVGATDLASNRVLIHEFEAPKNRLIDARVALMKGKIRVDWARETVTGKILIRDGVTIPEGTETPWLESCP